MLQATESAVKEFQRMLSEAKGNEAVIKIFTADGGCCGPSFGIDVFDNPENGDKSITSDGFKFYADEQAFTALENAVIDFVNQGKRRGFMIKGLHSSGCC